MKRIARSMMSAAVLILAVSAAIAQTKIDDQRMERDIEVAENVLGTMIKQQFEKRSFFPMEIEGNYMEGYGVTLRIPYELLGSPWFFGLPPEASDVTFLDGMNGSFSFSFDSDMEAPEAMEEAERHRMESELARDEQERANEDAIRSKTKIRVKNGSAVTEEITGPEYKSKPKIVSTKVGKDSIRSAYTNKIIEASKNFLADYGDLISQLSANEKITITNRGEGERIMFGAFGNVSSPSYISVEALKGDIVQYRQGKLTHNQLIAKIKVINTELEDELQPDLELLSSIISRLYRPDLSTTYFTQENIHYERMKDFGVIYYMQVFSSNTGAYGNYIMPTLRLENVDAETRDKKVKELYPVFEKDIKENILDYGRTLKSLGDDEVLMFNIKLTRCSECGIPSSLELSVKSSVLKDVNSGKLTKEAAIAKIVVKKGPNQ
ncbi:MAG: hypothetical protein AABY93_18605 [Bacteroidota bacterium]